MKEIDEISGVWSQNWHRTSYVANRAQKLMVITNIRDDIFETLSNSKFYQGSRYLLYIKAWIHYIPTLTFLLVIYLCLSITGQCFGLLRVVNVVVFSLSLSLKTKFEPFTWSLSDHSPWIHEGKDLPPLFRCFLCSFFFKTYTSLPFSCDSSSLTQVESLICYK